MKPVNEYSECRQLNESASGSYSYISQGLRYTAYKYAPFGGEILSASKGMKVADIYIRYGFPSFLLGMSESGRV